jgi:hypothetical protein
VQYFVKIFGFAIFGLIMKICGFAALHTSEICGFVRAEGAQEFADFLVYRLKKVSLPTCG